MAKRFVVSPLGKEVQGAVQSFIENNAKEAADLKDTTLEDSAEAMSQVIAYGIAKALSGSSFGIGMASGVCPPSGGPFGSLIQLGLIGVATES